MKSIFKIALLILGMSLLFSGCGHGDDRKKGGGKKPTQTAFSADLRLAFNQAEDAEPIVPREEVDNSTSFDDLLD